MRVSQHHSLLSFFQQYVVFQLHALGRTRLCHLLLRSCPTSFKNVCAIWLAVRSSRSSFADHFDCTHWDRSRRLSPDTVNLREYKVSVKGLDTLQNVPVMVERASTSPSLASGAKKPMGFLTSEACVLSLVRLLSRELHRDCLSVFVEGTWSEK